MGWQDRIRFREHVFLHVPHEDLITSTNNLLSIIVRSISKASPYMMHQACVSMEVFMVSPKIQDQKSMESFRLNFCCDRLSVTRIDSRNQEGLKSPRNGIEDHLAMSPPNQYKYLQNLVIYNLNTQSVSRTIRILVVSNIYN